MHDLFMVAAAWLVALFVSRSIIAASATDWPALVTSASLIILLQGLVHWRVGLYRGLWRFASLPDLANLVKVAVLAGISGTAVLFVLEAPLELVMLVVWLFRVLLLLRLGVPRQLYRLFTVLRLDGSHILQMS